MNCGVARCIQLCAAPAMCCSSYGWCGTMWANCSLVCALLVFAGRTWTDLYTLQSSEVWHCACTCGHVGTSLPLSVCGQAYNCGFVPYMCWASWTFDLHRQRRWEPHWAVHVMGWGWVVFKFIVIRTYLVLCNGQTMAVLLRSSLNCWSSCISHQSYHTLVLCIWGICFPMH
jgi:hypothetical protein